MDVHDFKKSLAEKGLRGLALDIDEVLSDTNPQWFRYMLRFQEVEGATFEELMSTYSFIEHVPAWRNEAALQHMKEVMHSSDFNGTLPLISGADAAVRRVHAIMPILAYVTARPSTVLEATRAWLRKHGFPEADIIARTDDVRPTEEDLINKNTWKAGVLHALYPEILGIVDDNPVLARELESLGYKGKLFLYGEANREFKASGHVAVCPTWEDVCGAIEALPPGF